MVDLIYLVAPIFLIILLGNILKRSLISDDAIWYQINSLTYWVLFPCLLFNKTSVIDFESFSIGMFSVSLMVGFLVAVLFCIIVGKAYGMSASTFSSVIQGGGRHNSFLALAVASQILGEQGELIGTIAIAVMVSFSNILTIIMLTIILRKNSETKPNILLEIFRNPFIIAIGLGLIFNFLNLGNLPILHDFTGYIGKAALVIALICVGAGLRFVGGRQFILPAAIACFAKMIIFPATVFLLTQYFNLSPILTISAVIFAIVPTSSTSYALAKQMGGDAPLMAAIISLQTLLSVFAIPLAVVLVS
mgnify:CR=1 FL=1